MNEPLSAPPAHRERPEPDGDDQRKARQAREDEELERYPCPWCGCKHRESRTSADVINKLYDCRNQLVEQREAVAKACELVLDRHSYQGTGEPWPWMFDKVRAALSQCPRPAQTGVADV